VQWVLNIRVEKIIIGISLQEIKKDVRLQGKKELDLQEKLQIRKKLLENKYLRI
jgi:hypothetical protein